MNNVWILVCDAAHARLYECRDGETAWQPIEVFEHPESRQRAADLVTDHAGQRAPEGNGAHHNALAPSSYPKEVEKEHFGHALATVLDRAMRQRRFHRWVLVSPPHFLGMIKKELTPELFKHLMATVSEDLTRLGDSELVARLQDVVRLPPDQRAAVREPVKHPH